MGLKDDSGWPFFIFNGSLNLVFGFSGCTCHIVLLMSGLWHEFILVFHDLAISWIDKPKVQIGMCLCGLFDLIVTWHFHP